MSVEAIESYFSSNIYKPFFMVVGDKAYQKTKAKLAEAGDVAFLFLSKCCRTNDKKPDLDKLKEALRMADIDCQSNKVVLLGLGEYLALEGYEIAEHVLSELISFNLGSAHVVFLLRNVADVVKHMVKGDPRLRGRQIEIDSDVDSSLSFSFSSIELSMYQDTGFMRALEEAEDGKKASIAVNTALEFPNAIITVNIVKNPYEAICKIDRDFRISKKYGAEDNWSDLLVEVNHARTVDSVFTAHGFDNSVVDFYQRIAGVEYNNWLYYLFLLNQKESERDAYLNLALSMSGNFEEFKTNVLHAITRISHMAPDFAILYEHRKKIVSQYPDSDIAAFVANNRFDSEESVYKLTDNTLVEQEEIIADISQHGMPTGLEKIYPDLALYLEKYHFNGDALNDLLTSYFESYKKQKISNQLNEDFLKQVDELAESRDYNRLRTRDEIMAGIDTTNTFLCWIDALGVEYLSYIVGLAQRKGLSTSVKVGRADLPTITSINKKFYDIWPEENKRKVEDLDDVKHNEKGGYKYGPSNQYPIHLAKELRIISDVIDEAATDLGLRKYDKYVIASDHGASRLAVLRKKEEKYETDTQGEHSGRCCKVFENYDLPFATEENGYIVLADYGRFKKSRAANVEVHGGASLEEVLVPIVTFSLRDSSIVIKPVEEKIKADYKAGATIKLFVNKSISQELYVEYKGKKYKGKAIDSNHYEVIIDEIKRAGNVEAEVYLDESLVSHISLKAVGKSASMNSDFDDLM